MIHKYPLRVNALMHWTILAAEGWRYSCPAEVVVCQPGDPVLCPVRTIAEKYFDNKIYLVRIRRGSKEAGWCGPSAKQGWIYCSSIFCRDLKPDWSWQRGQCSQRAMLTATFSPIFFLVIHAQGHSDLNPTHSPLPRMIILSYWRDVQEVSVRFQAIRFQCGSVLWSSQCRLVEIYLDEISHRLLNLLS